MPDDYIFIYNKTRFPSIRKNGKMVVLKKDVD